MFFTRASLVVQTVKNPPVVQETRVPSLGQEYPLEREWLPTPIFLAGEFHGQRSLMGYSPWGQRESNTTKQQAHKCKDIDTSAYDFRGFTSPWGSSSFLQGEAKKYPPAGPLLGPAPPCLRDHPGPAYQAASISHWDRGGASSDREDGICEAYSAIFLEGGCTFLFTHISHYSCDNLSLPSDTLGPTGLSSSCS